MSFVNTLVTQAVGPMAEAAAAALCAGVSYLFFRLTQWIGTKTKNEKLMGVISRLDDATAAGVRALTQTTVAALKDKASDGKLTADDAKSVKDQAVALIKSSLGGQKGVEEVKKILGVEDIDAFIAARVEAAVHALSVKA